MICESAGRSFRRQQDVRFADLPPFPRRNGRFDLDGAEFAERVVAVAAPGPVFGMRDESAMDWVAVDVLQFLDALLGITHIEVVISRLPEMLGATYNSRLVVWVFLS